MVNITEKIKEIESEMARTQKNKATEYHLGLLKGKLARLRAQLLEPGPGGAGGGGTGFDVSKSGDARIALVGFPSVGKSTFLSRITKTKAAVAAYAFTTLTAIPGVLEYGGAEIQILDLPGIIEGAAEGKGRGRQVISAAKTSDLICMILDATKRAEQRKLLEAELEAVGIRLNREPPNIYLKAKKAGGVKVTFQATPKNLDERMIYNILKDYKMLNCDVLVRDENGMLASPLQPLTQSRLTKLPVSYRRRLHRCDYEGSPEIHKMVGLSLSVPYHEPHPSPAFPLFATNTPPLPASTSTTRSTPSPSTTSTSSPANRTPPSCPASWTSASKTSSSAAGKSCS